ncbi:MAG TPA: peptidoglycan-associated lipoprotein Pal [Candidatus Eisenbacteria bacterium]
MKPKFVPTLLASSVLFALTLGTPGCARRTAQAPPQSAAPPPVAVAAPEPAPPPPEAPAPPPAPAEFQSAYFDFDSYGLHADAREALDQDAKLMRDQTGLMIRIEGHCDERGTVEYNMALGERRANAARDYLTAAGIAPDRIHIVSYGKEHPLVAGHDETAWAKNRCARVVVRSTEPAALNTDGSK